MIRIGLIQFPGSNCERETALAVQRAQMQPVDFLWNEPVEKLQALDGYILVGGFSYEDRSRAGIIAALDPILQKISEQAERGKPVLGICNGAQILLEAGLVPGLVTEHTLALTENKRIVQDTIQGSGFYNEWVHLRLHAQHKPNAFTRHLSINDRLCLPVAHSQGRFLMPENFFAQLAKQGLTTLQYCDAQGHIRNDFPCNPNGSVGNLAALSNTRGNILAIMPHPERTPEGDPLFSSMREYIQQLEQETLPWEKPNSPTTSPTSYRPKDNSKIYCLKLIITDNEANTVEKTMHRLGFPVQVKRFDHWEVICDCPNSLMLLKQSGLLFSDRKQKEVTLRSQDSGQTISYLVRAKDDVLGQHRLQSAIKHQGLQAIQHIQHGVVWQFSGDLVNLRELAENNLLTNLIGNAYAHEYFLLP